MSLQEPSRACWSSGDTRPARVGNQYCTTWPSALNGTGVPDSGVNCLLRISHRCADKVQGWRRFCRKRHVKPSENGEEIERVYIGWVVSWHTLVPCCFHMLTDVWNVSLSSTLQSSVMIDGDGRAVLVQHYTPGFRVGGLRVVYLFLPKYFFFINLCPNGAFSLVNYQILLGNG